MGNASGIPPLPPKRKLTRDELEQRLREQIIDRHFKQATLDAYAGAQQQAGVIRQLFTERLDAFKWVAAISTAAFFFLGQGLVSTGRVLAYDARVSALVADVGFLASVTGAALYMFIVDGRASRWHRSVFIRTSHVIMLLSGIDASTDELRDGLDRNDLEAANATFWEMVEAKQELGKAVAERLHVIREGRLAGFASALCVCGLVVGLLSAGYFEWVSVLSRP